MSDAALTWLRFRRSSGEICSEGAAASGLAAANTGWAEPRMKANAVASAIEAILSVVFMVGRGSLLWTRPLHARFVPAEVDHERLARRRRGHDDITLKPTLPRVEHSVLGHEADRL